MRDYLQKVFIRFLVKDVFHTITADDIFKVNKNGQYTFKGKVMNEDTVAKLQVQAANFKDSTLWQVLKTELQFLAAKSVMEKATSEVDVRVGQIQGYLTQVIDRKLEDLTK